MKFIIEIEDDCIETKDGLKLYKAKNFNALVFDEIGLSRLEKIDDSEVSKTINNCYDNETKCYDSSRKYKG